MTTVSLPMATPQARPRRSRIRALLQHPGAVVGLSILTILVVVAIAAPWLAPRDPLSQDFTLLLKPPGVGGMLGTDHLGRDILSRLIYGSRISMLVGLGAIAIGGTVGTFAGLVSGYFGGWADRLVVSVSDIFLSFPTILLALAFIAVIGSGMINVILALALAVWPGVARLVRGEVIRLRELQFVEAARAIGAADLTILLRHLFPNVLSSLIVVLTFDVGAAILTEASLGFLGLGVPPPLPTWGRIVSDGSEYIRIAPWAITFGGLIISGAILALNMLGDGLRDIFDPTLRHEE